MSNSPDLSELSSCEDKKIFRRTHRSAMYRTVAVGRALLGEGSSLRVYPFSSFLGARAGYVAAL